MDKQELDLKMSDMTKTLLAYCTARTSNYFEAEDLAQDMILEIYKSAGNIRNADAFYGFMWSVAGNVYKQWRRNKASKRECELPENLRFEPEPEADEDSALFLLRRELSLLAEKYRRAVILYYIENRSCQEISNILAISQSMVKYLLFKSRKILKEGMLMERNYGEQSYNPKNLSLLFWGKGPNRYYDLCDSIISQNILFACYNDRLTAEQISLEIGVGLPYMEDKLRELCEYDLLKKDGKRYFTNIVIFTTDLAREVSVKTAGFREKIAELLVKTISDNEKQVRAIGFSGADMESGAFAWQMVCFILYRAVVEKLQERIQIAYPRDKFGVECFVWGAEKGETSTWDSQFGFGISNVAGENGDYVQFMDFPINGEMVHHYYFNRPNVRNVFLDAARGNTGHFSENDRAEAAEMVRRGYIFSGSDGLRVNAPVFTQAQFDRLGEVFEAAAEEIAQEAEAMMDTVTKILREHMPLHLEEQAHSMAYLRLFEDAISAPVALLYERKYLLPYKGSGLLPTTYVILK